LDRALIFVEMKGSGFIDTSCIFAFLAIFAEYLSDSV